MTPVHQRRGLLIGLMIVCAFTVPLLGAPKASFNRIVVFGASLSDTGNAFALTGQQCTPPYGTLDPLLVPDAPYAKGGHHFSDGATWIEQFARPLGMAGDVRPAFGDADSTPTNYAIGGARARDTAGPNVLSAQVNAFLAGFGGVAPSDALYVFEMGGNDVRDALSALAGGEDPAPILGEAIAAIGSSISNLYAAGARKFLVWNAPDISLTPALLTLDGQFPGTAYYARLLASNFNAGLSGVLAALGVLPEIQIAPLDVFSLLGEMAGTPGDFDLSVVDTACIQPGTPPFECKQPDDYLFWDGIHPTKAAHAVVAARAATAVQALH